MTVAIIGQARSGTSLTAQMCAAAGLRLAGAPPGYEDARTMGPLATDGEWVTEFDAVKYVDAHAEESTFEAWRFDAVIVCRRRDTMEQAKSMRKFLQACGEKAPPARIFRRQIKRDAGWYLIRGLPLLELVFEDTLRNPMNAAERLVWFIGRGDPYAVASVVVARPPTCLPGFLELQQVGITDEELAVE